MIHSRKKILSVIFVLFILLNSAFTVNTEAASKKVTVYVVTSIQKNTSSNDHYFYRYNEDGLLIQSKHLIYEYDGNKLKKQTNRYGKSVNSDRKYEYNSKGQLIKHSGPVDKIKNHSYVSHVTGYYKFSYNGGGRIKKIKAYTGFCDEIATITYNSKKKISKISDTIYTDTERYTNTSKYYYDKKGYVRKLEYTSGDDNKKSVKIYKNTYDKNDCVVKIEVSTKGYEKTDVYKLTYKKMKVPASYKKTIENQQMALIPTGVYLGYYNFGD